MKKLVLLSAAAILLAGCSAPAAAESPAGSSSAASSPAAEAPVAKMSTAETCKKFSTVFSANQPTIGSSDSQKYWETVRDQLRPVAQSASDEVKPALDGMIAYYDTRAKHWDANTSTHVDASFTKEMAKEGTDAFDGMTKVCSSSKK